MDRDDSRRRQLESDTLSKPRLARSDVQITMPLDDREAPIEGARDEGYGRIVIRVGDHERETYSASRREILSLIFAAVGRPLPDWSQPEYRGYPLVVSGGQRRAVGAVAYVILPAAVFAAGLTVTRSKRRQAR